WAADHMPPWAAKFSADLVTIPCRLALRLWELILLTIVLQVSIAPLMALYFHRAAIVGIAANIPAILLTGVVVPLGFLCLGAGLLCGALGHALGRVLAAALGMLVGSVDWFARIPWASARVPSPPVVIVWLFFVSLVICSAAVLAGGRWQAWLAGAIPVAL